MLLSQGSQISSSFIYSDLVVADKAKEEHESEERI